jgi:hypothetical protein
MKFPTRADFLQRGFTSAGLRAEDPVEGLSVGAYFDESGL